MSGLYVVATPIGNLQDLSPRAIYHLQSCDLILAEDTRHSKILLEQFSINAPILSYYKFNEAKRTEEIINRILTENLKVSLICDAGTPGISDPGYIIVKEARKQSVPVFGVSGPSAVITALSISGLPASSFTFHGFPPTQSSNLRREFIRSLQKSSINTHVLYEAPHRILSLAQLIAEEIPAAEVCFCAELTKIHERSYYGPIADVLIQLKDDPYAEKGEYTVVISLRKKDEEETTDVAQEQNEDKKLNRTLEAFLVDVMVTKQVTLKEAVAIVSKENKFPKKQVYQASINLKELFKKYTLS